MGKIGRKKGMTIKINLTPKQRSEFESSQRKGKHSAWELRRMRILLLANDGLEKEEISKLEEVCEHTVYNTLKRFAESGSVKDRARSGRPEKFSGNVKAHVVAKACSEAPKGRSKWTLRLLAQEIMQLEIVDSISKSSVGKVLKKTNLNPGDKKVGA
jgi:transposase